MSWKVSYFEKQLKKTCRKLLIYKRRYLTANKKFRLMIYRNFWPENPNAGVLFLTILL